RHRPQGGRARLCQALRAGAGGRDKHCGSRWKRVADRDRRRVTLFTALPARRGILVDERAVEEVKVSRHILSGAAALGACLFGPAMADNASNKPDELQATIAACDKGASVPLDPDAKAPAVHFAEFYVRAENLDEASLDAARKLAATCKRALDGAPDQKR